METAIQLQPVRLNSTVPATITQSSQQEVITPEVKKKRSPFIEANTKEVDILHLRDECVVPVFRDNELTISHPQFIETVWKAANTFFRGETIYEPDIRVSHVIRNRKPEALHKPVNSLLDTDVTIFYERLAFCFEIPSIMELVDGNQLNLTIGGVRAYNHENFNSKKGVEKFKVFIGFKNLVCTNLCVSTDGYMSEIKVMSTQELFKAIMQLLQQYNIAKHLYEMSAYKDTMLSESQFAQFLGKSRLYQCLPPSQKKDLPELLMTDTQINLVAKAYYNDPNFSIQEDSKEISMWNFHNMLTGANRSSYIDNFLDRSLNATQLTDGINRALYGDKEYSWFIE